jgi:hypothetical protein
VDVVGAAGGSLLVLMMSTPSPFILISGLRYIYNVIQNLLQWLQVMRMLPHLVICSMEPESDVLGVKAGFLVGSYSAVIYD